MMCSSHLSSLSLFPQEDMNLNEERKAPLRGKDLSTKREMVVQYISTTAKSVSRCCKPMVFLYYISVMELMGFLHFIVTKGLF